MSVSHGALLLSQPVTVITTILRELIAGIAMGLFVFLPEQLLGDAFLLEFLVNCGTVRCDTTISTTRFW